jgi:ABC-2 type transport system permease protein
MQIAARINPLSYILDAERALFAGALASATVAWGRIAAAVTDTVGRAIGVRAIARSAD